MRKKIADSIVRKIGKSKAPVHEIADKYGVSHAFVSNVRNGVIHSKVTGLPIKKFRRKLSEKQIRAIYKSTNTTVFLALQYKVSISMVSQIKTGRMYSDITGQVYGERRPYMQWTVMETKYIIKNYGTMSVGDMADWLGRPRSQLYARINYLKKDKMKIVW